MLHPDSKRSESVVWLSAFLLCKLAQCFMNLVFEISSSNYIAFLTAIVRRDSGLVDCPVLVTCTRYGALMFSALQTITDSLSLGGQDWQRSSGFLSCGLPIFFPCWAGDTAESTPHSSALALVGSEQSAAETAIRHSHIVTFLGPAEHFSLPGFLCGLNRCHRQLSNRIKSDANLSRGLVGV